MNLPPPSTLRFDIIGAPAPQGSKRHVGNGVMVESSKAVRPWREAVAWAGREAMAGAAPFDSAVIVAIRFRLAPTGRWTKAEKAARERWKPRRPDIDKLIRATLDGLTEGGVLADDALVVRVSASKREVLGHSGADVWVRCAP